MTLTAIKTMPSRPVARTPTQFNVGDRVMLSARYWILRPRAIPRIRTGVIFNRSKLYEHCYGVRWDQIATTGSVHADFLERERT